MTPMDYTDWTKDDLVAEIRKLSRRKKYGLVWENRDEVLVEELENNIPLFEQVKSRAIITSEDAPECLLIEGDNLHSLQVLNYTHLGKIDLIYIDPPYNTGENDFKYNDDYVDKEDSYRHSKWLSFMHSRLILAKPLLSDDGMIFISINEIEMANLILLCDEIFGERNQIGIFPRLTKKGGKTTGTFASNHDFLLGWAKNKASLPKFKIELDDPKSFKLEDEYVAERGRHNLKQTLDYDSLTYSKGMDYPLVIDEQTYYPGGSKEAWQERQKGNHGKFDWTWRWSEELVRWGLSQGLIEIKGKERPRIYTKSYELANYERTDTGWQIVFEDRQKSPSSIHFIDNEFSNDVAKKELDGVLGKGKFEFPKPTSLIKFLINLHEKKDVTVLDFFAGSGSTGQAVVDLNIEDGQNRKFILATNNEKNNNDANSRIPKGICVDVTYPRIKEVIKGSKKSQGNANLRYFKTKLISSKLTDANRHFITRQAIGALCVREECYREVEINKEFHVYSGKSKMLGVLFDPNSIVAFKSFIAKHDYPTNVYVFSLGNDDYAEEFSEFKGRVLTVALPKAILNAYHRSQRLVKVNR